MPAKSIVPVGTRFNNLTVVGEGAPYVRPSGRKETRWLLLCDCGNYITVVPNSVKRGFTKSCGCLRKEMSRDAATRHGACSHPLYNVWNCMIQRCHNPSNKLYKYYGGRGIEVCSRWRESPNNFFEDMGERPLGFTLERCDNNLGYSPDNCIWATWEQQCQNKRAWGTALIDTEEENS